MKCWHCESELVLDFTTEHFDKFYRCEACEKWYEMSKDKAKINGAVPIRFFELDARPQYPANAHGLGA